MTLTPEFAGIFDAAGRGEVLIPRIRAALWEPDFEKFSIEMPDIKVRPPDGWFHPSTHPTMSARQLYYYLAHPDRLIPDPYGNEGVMAIMQGHFWHIFMETVGLREGWLIDPGPCRCGCGKREHYWEHGETRARGHGDGVTNAAVLPIDDNEVWEFKTMRGLRAKRIPEGAPDDPEVLAAFRSLCPEYYGQGQEYMRISGYRSWRAIILSLEYPFPLREITMKFDHAYAHEVSEKYRIAIDAAETDTPPITCCAPKSKEARKCEARAICPIGSVQ